MTEGAIIQLPQWLKTPAGEYLLAWEQRHLDQAVADVFGFHALQLGLPEVDALAANRMPHRWLATESVPAAPTPAGSVDTDAADGTRPAPRAATVAVVPMRRGSSGAARSPRSMHAGDVQSHSGREERHIRNADGGARE